VRRFVLALASIGLVLVAFFAFVWAGGVSAARRRPWPLEERATTGAWRLLVPRSTRNARNPVAPSPDVLTRAREHWADHCALCHANDGSGETTIGQRVYPKAPDLRAARTQTFSDGELFYAIEEGIPWTAMPGWRTGTSEGEQETWALVAFIRHLPSITADEVKEMERLNPKPPVNSEREKEIDDFLKGK
jgi:mono/diheme cytochrome c family protein